MPHRSLALCLSATGLLLIAAPGRARAEKQPTIAVPADAVLLRDLRKPGVIKAELKGQGLVHWIRAKGVFEYARRVEVTRKDGKDVTIVIGDVVYEHVPGQKGWRYARFRIGANRVGGMKEPDRQELLAILTMYPPRKVLHARVLGEKFVDVKIADDPKWIWHLKTSVSFRVIAVQWEKRNPTTKEKVQQEYEVRLYRDAEGDAWNKKCEASPPGRPRCVLWSKKGPRKVLETAACATGDGCR